MTQTLKKHDMRGTVRFKLEDIRKSMKLSISEMSVRCGITRKTYYSFIKGDIPRLETILQILYGLGLTKLDDLIELDKSVFVPLEPEKK